MGIMARMMVTLTDPYFASRNALRPPRTGRAWAHALAQTTHADELEGRTLSAERSLVDELERLADRLVARHERVV